MAANTAPHAWSGPVSAEDSPAVAESLAVAQRLRLELLELRARRNANRDLLRLLREQGSASPAQAAEIERLYPTKQTQAQQRRDEQRAQVAPVVTGAPAPGGARPPWLG